MVLGKRDVLPGGYVEVDIRRRGRSPYGNPFVMVDQEDDNARNQVCEAYAELLRTARRPADIARSYDPPLLVHEPSAAVKAHTRLEALSRLAERAQRENIALRCACKPLRCHGDTIAKWIADRLPASL